MAVMVYWSKVWEFVGFPSFAIITNKNSAHIYNNFTSNNVLKFLCKSTPLATCKKTSNGIHKNQTGWWQQHAGEGTNRRAFERQGGYGFERCWKKRDANRRWHTSIGWTAVTRSTNTHTGRNSWQLSYHSGTALTANFAVTVKPKLTTGRSCNSGQHKQVVNLHKCVPK